MLTLEKEMNFLSFLGKGTELGLAEAQVVTNRP